MALLNNNFRCTYYYGLMLCWLFSVSYVYAADIQAIKSPAFIQQEQLVKKIIQDLGVYQKKLEQLATNSQDLDVKYSQEFKRYKDLIANITKDIAEHQETIAGLGGKNDAEFNHYKELITSISEDIDEHQKKLKGLGVIIADFQVKTRGYDKNQKNINKAIDVLEKDMKDVRFKTASINKQKALIEENSIRLYEVLVDVRARYEYLFSELKQLKLAQEVYNNVYQDKNKVTDTPLDASMLQQFLSIICLFFIPLAFSFRQTQNTILKDGVPQYQATILITAGLLLGYYTFGYGLMYGDTWSGFIGITNPIFLAMSSLSVVVLPTDILDSIWYKTSFVLLAAMIISQIIGPKLSSVGHLILAVFVGIVLIPIAGHWVSVTEGWLLMHGFIDEMGTLLINIIPAWFALAVIYRRRDIIDEHPDNAMDRAPLYPASRAILFWLVCFGLTMNAVSASHALLSAFLNISLAAVAGSLSGFLYHAFFHANASRISRASGGFVGGLVAIMACAQTVTFPEALVIGAIAGVLHNMVTNVLIRHFLREHWQANSAQLIAIHGFCGIWGLLAVALFGSAGGFGELNMGQLWLQSQGILVALGYAVILGLIVAKIPFQRRKKPQVA